MMGVKRVKRVTYKGHFGGAYDATRNRRKPNLLHRTRVADGVVFLNLKLSTILISVTLPYKAKDQQVPTTCLDITLYRNLLSLLSAIIGEKFKGEPMRPKFSRMNSYLLFRI